MVKNARMKHRLSPGLSSTVAYRSETATPDSSTTARQRRLTPQPRKTTIPTLYVTEPQGAEARQRWVEVEEIIEYKVNKSPKPPRRRGASPAGSDRAHTPSSAARPRRSPPENPNANNSNNKLVKQVESQAELQGEGQPLSWDDNEGNMAESEAVPGFGGEACEVPSVLTANNHLDEVDETLLQEQVAIVTEPDDDDIIEDPLKKLEPKILIQGGRMLTLEDLEDYVPREGETYGSCDARPSPAEKPCEISVLQREIGGSSVGQPVLLNVGRPVAAAPRQLFGFFSRFREHLSSSLFHPAAAHHSSGAQSRREREVPIQVSRAGAFVHPEGGASVSSESHAKLEVKPSYCSEVQRVEGGQQSYKTKVSAQTYGYTSVGKPVTLQISKKNPYQNQ